VDVLEERYAAFPGLNLTFETREGILKHCSAARARALGEVGRRFLERCQPGLEAQLANIADSIAYNNHDVDDGLRSGLITLSELDSVPFFAEHRRLAEQRYLGVDSLLLGRETVRRMIDRSVRDLIATSEGAIAAAAPADIEAVRAQPQALIRFSDDVHDGHAQLKRFLRERLYEHPHVREMTQNARSTIRQLFAAFFADVGRMPSTHAARARKAAETDGAAGTARVVADYIAGMTDRFALQTREALE
jgi:dGTPase